jgi:glycosyltransferase involved in cell wall biosynthesis
VAEPLRVLELLVSTEAGGGPAHVLELASRLPRDEFEVTVAGPGAGVYAERFRAAGASFVEVATDRLSFRALGTVRRMVSENRIGLVHSHGKGAGLYGRLAARRANIPSLHTFHGIHYSGYPPGVRALYLALERRLAAMSAAVVHVSESQGREAEALGLAPAGKTCVIVNGVDAARLQAQALSRAAARAALDLDPATLALGTVARLDPVKALDVLLEAFARLAPRWPAARLVVIGGGSEAGRLRALAASLGIESRVRFLGALPDAARLLLGLDLYVSASRREGLPLALLEAMALGLPVVTTRVPGHLDAVTDGASGLLVAAGQAAALADAAGKLLADPERRRALGEAGRRRVEERFAVERMVAETAALYRAAVGRFPERKSPSAGV